VQAAVASFGPPRCVRASTGSLVDAFEPRIRDLLRGVSADAGDGESRSGSASRSDSLIEFVKTNVAILPLLILTATTGSDELSYGLNDTAVDGFWIGSNWSRPARRRWLRRWLRSWTPLHTMNSCMR
jgi:hypothetical protein